MELCKGDYYNAIPTEKHLGNLTSTDGADTVNLFATFFNSVYEACQVNKTIQMSKVINILNNFKITYQDITNTTFILNQFFVRKNVYSH